jgi:hypothetical protein
MSENRLVYKRGVFCSKINRMKILVVGIGPSPDHKAKEIVKDVELGV